MEENLDTELLKKYNLIKQQLSAEDVSSFHLKSVDNFIYHLVENPSTDRTRFKKLQKINEVRFKKVLLEYLEKVECGETDKDDDVENFNQYLYPVGLFMVNHYGFSNSGGKTKYFGILMFVTGGVFLDVVLQMFIEISIPIFTLSFLAIEIFRIYRKRKEKKVFGLHY